MIRPPADTALMEGSYPAESSAVPENIKRADRWRQLGEELRRLDPEAFDAILFELVMNRARDDEDLAASITKSYFLT